MNDHSKDSMRLIIRISRDILFVAVASSVYFAFNVYFHVLDSENKTGFFCSDKNLWYPYKLSTVTTEFLLIYVCTLTPFITFILVEGKWNQSGVIRFFGFNIPLWIPQTYTRIIQYVFGFYLQMSFMLFPKFFDSPQFLRPHFMAVCQPIIGPQNITCHEIPDPNLFVTDYECTGELSEREMKNIYWTFPSGHSSCSFYTAVYLIIYLQFKVRSTRLRGFKFIAQFFLLLSAFGIAITRLQDHHHHAVDVVCGALLGTIVAIVGHFCFSKFFPSIRDLTGFANHGVENNNLEGIDINNHQK